ncbi:MAG: GyrI-like domain-containing protein [Alphaproteobacteria bacterium]|nr:GyrI-like domain-containing protein [Alphaproteobacteria bacterium]
MTRPADNTNNYEVKAGLAEVEAFTVTGVSIITDHTRAAEDINALWERFFTERIGQKLESKADEVIIAVYSDYKGGFEDSYRLTIGYRTAENEPPQNGLHAVKVMTQNYAVMSAGGTQPKALIETWEAIWSGDLPRSFKTDFELYGPRFFEEGVHEVLVHVGLKP